MGLATGEGEGVFGSDLKSGMGMMVLSGEIENGYSAKSRLWTSHEWRCQQENFKINLP